LGGVMVIGSKLDSNDKCTQHYIQFDSYVTIQNFIWHWNSWFSIFCVKRPQVTADLFLDNFL